MDKVWIIYTETKSGDTSVTAHRDKNGALNRLREFVKHEGGTETGTQEEMLSWCAEEELGAWLTECEVA